MSLQFLWMVSICLLPNKKKMYYKFYTYLLFYVINGIGNLKSFHVGLQIYTLFSFQLAAICYD